jgi:hypothetical protein
MMEALKVFCRVVTDSGEDRTWFPHGGRQAHAPLEFPAPRIRFQAYFPRRIRN